MNKTLHHSADIPYIPQFFHPTENLTYPFQIATQRFVRSSCILNLKNERLKLGHGTSIHGEDSGGDDKNKVIKKGLRYFVNP